MTSKEQSRFEQQIFPRKNPEDSFLEYIAKEEHLKEQRLIRVIVTMIVTNLIFAIIVLIYLAIRH